MLSCNSRPRQVLVINVGDELLDGIRENGHLLWLGEPGKFAGEKPTGVTFMEGAAARTKWHELRNQWLTAHGYDPRSAEDWDPMQAPVAAPKLR